MRFDIVIVGGGIAGSSAAWMLAKKGYKVAVLEREKSIGHKVCGGLVSRRVIKISKTDAIMNEIKGARIFFPDGNEIMIGGDKTYAYVIDRERFDNEMAERAMAEGAKYFFNFEVKSVGKRKIEGKESIEFDFLVGADGAKSRIAEIYEMGNIEYINAIQGFSHGKEMDLVHVYLDDSISPGFFSWAIPDGDKLRVGLGSVEKKTMEKLKMLERKVGKKVEMPKGAIIPVGMRKFYFKNVALIGDAAGQVKATSGGGLYAILIASRILADSFPDFREYERNFMKEFGKEIKRTLIARRIFLKMDNGFFNHLAIYLKKDVELINKHGDIDYQSRVAKEFIKRHPILALSLMKRFFI